MDTDALTRFFEGIGAGLYIGTIAPGGETTTSAVNPHLRRIFGFAAGAPVGEVLPFHPDRFAEPQAREAFVAVLEKDGGVADYLLRMRRPDGATVWTEVT